jgi:peptidoglycan/xylan/chitin deacetylase (PgdA/CDA1 family)
MIILIAAMALCVIVGIWGITLFDSETASDTLVTTPADTSETETTTASDGPTVTTQTTETNTTETTKNDDSFVKPMGKYIVLTFDDGPSLYYTPEVLDILEKYNAKATFFVNGYQLSSSKVHSLKRAIALGCEIGNHTESHANLTKLTPREIYDEIQSTNDKVRELCGYNMTLLRPPGGNTNLSVMQAMYDSGLRMHTIMWNNDSLDWSFNADFVNGEISEEEAVRKTYEMILCYPLDGAIVLMHDIKGVTPAALELLLQKLTAEGYSFLTVSELFDFESMGKDAYFTKFYADGYYTTLK